MHKTSTHFFFLPLNNSFVLPLQELTTFIPLKRIFPLLSFCEIYCSTSAQAVIFLSKEHCHNSHESFYILDPHKWAGLFIWILSMNDNCSQHTGSVGVVHKCISKLLYSTPLEWMYSKILTAHVAVQGGVVFSIVPFCSLECFPTKLIKPILCVYESPAFNSGYCTKWQVGPKWPTVKQILSIPFCIFTTSCKPSLKT